jgi:hypothetical protein
MINAALRRWKANESLSVEKLTGSNTPDGRYNLNFPQGGLILRETMRDLPRADDPNFKTWRHNFDHAWLTADELKSFAPAKLEVGHKYEIPTALVRRFAAYHVVDQVKGEADAWKRSEVELAEIQAEVVSNQGGKIEIQLRGVIRCVKPPTGEVNPYSKTKIRDDRGVDLKIRGRLTYDSGEKYFRRFDLLAIGDRWGAATYNFRSRDMGPAPIGFAFEMLPEKPENKTRPKFLLWNYFD